MNNILRSILLLIVSLSSCAVYALKWDTVGSACFSTGATNDSHIALDKNGTPYIAFTDGAHGDSVTVMKYNGNNWIIVGIPAFSHGSALWVSLAIDTGSIPFIAYSDYDNGGKITVMKYDGSNWIDVGIPLFSANAAWFPSLAISTTCTPYVVYSDVSNDWSGPATVMKYDGSNWITVGNPGFSAGPVIHSTITIDGNGTPYVLYIDSVNSYNTTVMKYDGVNWVAVGAQGFGTIVYKYTPTILTDASGVSFVAFASRNFPFRSIVMKYNGANWVNVGSNATVAEAHYTSMALDNTGTPYIAYEDWSESHNRTTVRKYDGTQWINVGNTSFSADTVHNTDIVIDKNGNLYVSFIDAGTVTGSFKTTVMRLRSTVDVKEIKGITPQLSVTPNPCQGKFTLNIPSIENDNATVCITDITGKKVNELIVPVNKQVCVTIDYSPGVYFINALTTHEKYSGKIIITP